MSKEKKVDRIDELLNNASNPNVAALANAKKRFEETKAAATAELQFKRLSAVNDVLEHSVNELRAARALAKRIEKQVKTIDSAMEKFAADGNVEELRIVIRSVGFSDNVIP